MLFAGDAFMSLPYIVDGDIDEMIASVKRIGRMGLENIIQGHGDIILRGEIDAAVKENMNYLNNIKKLVKAAGKRKNADEYLDAITIEEWKEPRVPRRSGRDIAQAQSARLVSSDERRIIFTGNSF